MNKYYRLKTDSFLWKKGAILAYDGGGYRPIEDIWDVTDKNENEYISSRIVENNPEHFERVYKSRLEEMAFETKEVVMETYNKMFKKKYE